MSWTAPETLFWIIAVIFAGGALLFLLPPLLKRRAGGTVTGRRGINIAVYRDQLKELEADRASGLLGDSQYESAKLELEARLLEDAGQGDETTQASRRTGTILAALLVLAVPAAAFALYFVIGNPAAIPESSAQRERADMGHNVDQLVSALEGKLRANPQDGRGWVLLGRTYGALGRWPEAEQAYARGVALLPGEAAALSAYAESIAINAGRVLEGRAIELVRKALAADANDMKGLELAGVHAMQTEKYAEAAGYWQRLLQQVSPDSDYAAELRAALAEAERLAGQPAGKSGGAAATGASISGELSLAPALQAKASAGDTVFIFARDPSGNGPPLAAQRLRVADLPKAFRLDDSMAMMPDNTLSSRKTVELTARVSKSGSPQGGSGDLEGRLEAVKVGSQGVKLVIDRIRP